MSLAKKDSAGSKEDEDRKGNHKFWSTQPVMDYGIPSLPLSLRGVTFCGRGRRG